jgi:hypothetical protein
VYLAITTGNGVSDLAATDEHPFWVLDGTDATAGLPVGEDTTGVWVNAVDLKVGDVLLTASGETALVSGTQTRESVEWAYNFTVANTHTYYAGEEPVLTHNEQICTSPSLSPVWKGMKTARPGVKVAGKGPSRTYSTWDYKHGDIEVFSRSGRHLGSRHPFTGAMHKPAVPGRRLKG